MGGTIRAVVLVAVLALAAGAEAEEPADNRGPFALVDHIGRAVTDRTWLGSYVLIYFGYSFCLDICPTDLAVLAAAVDGLGADGARVRQVARAVETCRARYRRADPDDDGPDYLINHTAASYLPGPDGNGLALFQHGTPAIDIAAVIRRFMALERGGDDSG